MGKKPSLIPSYDVHARSSLRVRLFLPRFSLSEPRFWCGRRTGRVVLVVVVLLLGARERVHYLTSPFGKPGGANKQKRAQEVGRKTKNKKSNDRGKAATTPGQGWVGGKQAQGKRGEEGRKTT